MICTIGSYTCPQVIQPNVQKAHLEVVVDALWAEALGDHHHPALYVEAQRHLGTALLILPPDGHQQLVFQQGRTF